MSYYILDSIGNTPLVEIKYLNPMPGVRIFAKIEYMNPGGSIKDRAALFMINAAEASGKLTRDKIVIEATSGNTGIGLAMVCAVKGYKLVLTMDENASEERKRILKARGADIILTPKHLGADGAIEEAYRLARENPDRYFITDQYSNDANWQAHYHTTGPEIYAQTDGHVTSIVASVGTSGTLMGLSRYFKELSPIINIVCAQPYLGHKIQGLKNMKESYPPEIFDKKRLDRVIYVEDEAAFEMTRLLASKEGLFVGMSSGAAMVAAVREAERIGQGIIVVIFPDSGERYLSTSLFSPRKEINLHLYDTMTRQKKSFRQLKNDSSGIYTCGPTVDRRLHIGRFRRFIFTDLLIRYLEFCGLNVNHVVNITDYDDKTIKGAKESGLSLQEFTEPHIEQFKQDLDILGIRKAQSYPLVSEHLNEMADLNRLLLARGYAYEKFHSVYFDISKFQEYGRLSGVDLEKIRLGATVDLDDYEKLNPRDFTLFKRVKLSELKRGVGMKTEWGNVRPSLHLQCASISMKKLGTPFDIHTGSRELIFPHHENEAAIAKVASGSDLANIWMHCAPVLYDGSLDENLFMDDREKEAVSILKTGERIEQIFLDTLIKKSWTPKMIRFWLLSGHYRKPLTLSLKTLNHTRFILEKINRCIESLGTLEDSLDSDELEYETKNEASMSQIRYDIRQGVVNALSDDLDIPKTISSLLGDVKKINIMINNNSIDPAGAKSLLACFKSIDSILNVFDFKKRKTLSSEISDMIRKREEARKKKDWATADEIRETLYSMGIFVHDKKGDK